MNKRHDQCEQLEMYAVDGLNAEERAEFEQHLIECQNCVDSLAELASLVDLLPLSSEPVEVPSGMKERILGHILQHTATEGSNVEPDVQSVGNPESATTRAQSAGPGKFRPWIYSGLAAAVIVLGIYNFNLQKDVKDLKTELASINEPVQGVKVNKAVTLSSATADIVAKGLATIVIDSKGTHLLVQAEKLPELKGTEAYQVWLVKDGNVVNAGTFMTHNGSGGLYYTFDPSDYDQIAITLEPDAHGETPRGTAVLAANLLGS
ncbi:anti-sigma factor [Paenibacillus eucommiae]|uniref:Regulator of SigK n=1 Tax=Paenibacillus eucommiae TaxID=1355755 RepID=A0ABS4J2B4_9BACL|nr:anti-sigma factor [Paenibacillus eucommiae]MBP1992954.1 hypothetical protein [Paenibacillus eucommiae]